MREKCAPDTAKISITSFRMQLRHLRTLQTLRQNIERYGVRLCAEGAGYMEACVGGEAHEEGQERTWLANCVRRILRQLMVAVTEEWRDWWSGGSTWCIRCTSGNGGCDRYITRLPATLIGQVPGLGCHEVQPESFHLPRLFFLSVMQLCLKCSDNSCTLITY